MSTPTPTVLAYVKFAVYGDYDGNAPDTSELLVCDTRAEAELAAKTAQAELADDNNSDSILDIVPFVDGWQHRLRYRVREILVRADA